MGAEYAEMEGGCGSPRKAALLVLTGCAQDISWVGMFFHWLGCWNRKGCQGESLSLGTHSYAPYR